MAAHQTAKRETVKVNQQKGAVNAPYLENQRKPAQQSVKHRRLKYKN
jgi:hypothetical protein